MLANAVLPVATRVVQTNAGAVNVAHLQKRLQQTEEQPAQALYQLLVVLKHQCGVGRSTVLVVFSIRQRCAVLQCCSVANVSTVRCCGVAIVDDCHDFENSPAAHDDRSRIATAASADVVSCRRVVVGTELVWSAVQRCKFDVVGGACVSTWCVGTYGAMGQIKLSQMQQHE